MFRIELDLVFQLKTCFRKLLPPRFITYTVVIIVCTYYQKIKKMMKDIHKLISVKFRALLIDLKKDSFFIKGDAFIPIFNIALINHRFKDMSYKVPVMYTKKLSKHSVRALDFRHIRIDAVIPVDLKLLKFIHLC